MPPKSKASKSGKGRKKPAKKVKSGDAASESQAVPLPNPAVGHEEQQAQEQEEEPPTSKRGRKATPKFEEWKKTTAASSGKNTALIIEVSFFTLNFVFTL